LIQKCRCGLVFFLDMECITVSGNTICDCPVFNTAFLFLDLDIHGCPFGAVCVCVLKAAESRYIRSGSLEHALHELKERTTVKQRE